MDGGEGQRDPEPDGRGRRDEIRERGAARDEPFEQRPDGHVHEARECRRHHVIRQRELSDDSAGHPEGHPAREGG